LIMRSGKLSRGPARPKHVHFLRCFSLTELSHGRFPGVQKNDTQTLQSHMVSQKSIKSAIRDSEGIPRGGKNRKNL